MDGVHYDSVSKSLITTIIYLSGKACQPDRLYSFSCLSYNGRDNWSDESLLGPLRPNTRLSAILPLFKHLIDPAV